MKAEIQFFALPTDAEQLLTFVKNKVDSLDSQSEDVTRLIIGDCEITYTSGKIKDYMLLAGSFAINTGTVDDACADQERAKTVYRDVRRWFKKNYSNKLNTYMLEGARRDKAARNHWISTAAKAWVIEDASRILKLYDTSPIAFEIMIVSKQMGAITPVESNKVRGHG